MFAPGVPTFDQLAVFLAVVETGSFAGASRKLGRAASVISYSIANLEAQLGLELFDRTTRRPKLTDAGRMALSQARVIARGVDDLRARALEMLKGLEAEVTIAVDVMFPTDWLTATLTKFGEIYPTVSLYLRIEALGAVSKLVSDRKAIFGITCPLNTEIEGLQYRNIGSVKLLPVAAPGHPLANPAAKAASASRDHIQLVLTDRSDLTEGQEFQVAAVRTWRLADLGAKHALLRAGFGWGNMPLPMVEEDLASGRLVNLDLSDVRGGDYPFRIVQRVDAPPGIAGRWLIEEFARISEA